VKTMKQIIQLQKQAAKAKDRAWWFGPDETRFFDSRIESEAFTNPAVGPIHYFVTSEQCHFSDGTSAPRLYSVRYWSEEEPERVQTWGKFQQFKTKEAATRVATRLGVYGALKLGAVEEDD
jgi:hypothetical protein